MNTNMGTRVISAAVSRSVRKAFIACLAVLLMGATSTPRAHAKCPVDDPDCHRPPKPIVTPAPVPPTPSSSATGGFSILLYRYFLDQAGQQVLDTFRKSGRTGTLSWSGRPPMKCGHACVDPPTPPTLGRAALTQGWLNFHWEFGWSLFGVSKDVSILTELDATCANWQTGQGHLILTTTVYPIALAGQGNWAADAWDFFTNDGATDYAVDTTNRFLREKLAQYAGGSQDLGPCRSLGVSLDNPTGIFDAFVWDQ